MHLLKLIVFPLVLSLFLAPSLNAATPANDKTLKVGIVQEWDVLHPLIWTTYPAALISSATLRGFVKSTPTGGYEPGVIEKVPKIQKIQKLKKSVLIQFKIKDSAKWGDGQPMTCDDLKLSWEIGKHPKTSVMSKEDFEVIEKVEWPKDNNKLCSVFVKENRYLLAETVLPAPIPSHLERAVFEKFAEGGQYASETLYIKDPTNPGLYNGPYVVEELSRGSHIILKKNPHWNGTLAQISKVFIKYLPSTDALINALKTHEVNFAGAVGLSAEQALGFEATIESMKLPLKVEYESQSSLERLIFKLDNEFLKDPVLRHVLAESLDRKTLVTLASKGKFEAADNPIVATAKKTAFTKLNSISKKSAAETLAKAGYKLGADGTLSKNGKAVEITLSTTAGNRTRETNLTFIADQWKQLGIKTTIKNSPARVLIGQILRCRQFDGAIEVAFDSMPDSIRKDAYASTNIPTDKNNCTGLNASGWNNPKVDKILDQLDVELIPKKRQKLLEDFTVEYIKDLPEIPLYKVAVPVIFPSSLKGSTKTGPSGLNFSQIETWAL